MYSRLTSLFILLSQTALCFADRASTSRAISESKYTVAHYLGDDYFFDQRDGWHIVNVTNLQYKYRRNGQSTFDPVAAGLKPQLTARKTPAPKKTPTTDKKGLGGALGKVLDTVFKGLKGIGKPEDVTITWYTGHDLKNPSCWNKGSWAPSDQSFAAALTLDGWKDRPQCFKFLELCNSKKMCVFVRVVDTCAGCAPGSKHVDLTRAAFGQLAVFDEGVLQVHMRHATEPKQWFQNLWGPKVHKK